MRTYTESEMQRASVAREEFLAAYCQTWPAPYRNLVPLTCDGKKLAEAKLQIEAMMRQDLAAMVAEDASPWRKVGPEPMMIDWAGVSSDDRCLDALERTRPVGMPAPVKAGCWNHPEVVQARRNAHRTAEFVAMVKDRNLGEDESAHTEFERLRANPTEGLAIVRDPLTDDAIEAEMRQVRGEA